MESAKRFFQPAVATGGQVADRVTTDGHDAYPRAIRETLGDEVAHRCSAYLNNRLEHDLRGITQRSYPMRGFAQRAPNAAVAGRFCRAFDEQRQYCRMRITLRQRVPSLAEQRRADCAQWRALMGELLAA